MMSPSDTNVEILQGKLKTIEYQNKRCKTEWTASQNLKDSYDARKA